MLILPLVLLTSVDAKARIERPITDCSAQGGVQLLRCLASLRRNQGIGLDDSGVDVRNACDGSSNIEDCMGEVYRKQSKNNVNVLADCTENDSNIVETCIEEWIAFHIQQLSFAAEVPSTCEELENDGELKRCLAAPTFSPTLSQVSSPTTAPARQPSENEISFTTSSSWEQKAILDIGTYLMSLTTYTRTIRNTITSENGVLSMKLEMEATRQHLRETYEDVFLIPVISVDLNFINDGVTALSKSQGFDSSMIQHSTFFGNVTFAVENARTLPTPAQLETVTINAFLGALKESFIKQYHFRATGSNYFGVKHRYDVSVRKLHKNEAGIAAATQGVNIQGTDIDEIEDASIGRSKMFIGVMAMFASVLVGTFLGMMVLIRKRRLDRVDSALSIQGDFVVEDIDVIGSNVESDVSISPLQLMEESDSHISHENISHVVIDISPGDANDDKEESNISENRGDDSIWTYDSKKDPPCIDIEIEIDSHCKELLSSDTKR